MNRAIGIVLILLVFAAPFIGMRLTQKPALPKYKAGDCVSIDIMTITSDRKWDSSGYRLGSLKILQVLETDSMNTYMAKRLHARKFYVVRPIELEPELKKYHAAKRYVIPVEDLDGYRYAGVYWRDPAYNVDKCNAYR